MGAMFTFTVRSSRQAGAQLLGRVHASRWIDAVCMAGRQFDGNFTVGSGYRVEDTGSLHGPITYGDFKYLQADDAHALLTTMGACGRILPLDTGVVHGPTAIPSCPRCGSSQPCSASVGCGWLPTDSGDVATDTPVDTGDS